MGETNTHTVAASPRPERMVRLSIGLRSIAARTSDASDDLKHLSVTLEPGLYVPGDGYITQMALGFDNRVGNYRDLIRGDWVLVDWLCDACNARSRGVEGAPECDCAARAEQAAKESESKDETHAAN